VIDVSDTPWVCSSPEMVDLYSNDPVDERVDVWALGCLLYTLCFFVHPFGTAGNLGILAGRCVTAWTPPSFHDCC
jgi:serine/threonine protein kinase